MLCSRVIRIFLLVIPVVSIVVAAEPAPDPESGWISLFDGKSLDGWDGPPGSYVVENGVLVCVAGGHGNLLSKSEYQDFQFRFEFKLSAGANNGLGIRCPKQLEGNLHLDGIELQILDDTAEKYAGLKSYQYHGSVYGIIAARRGALKPVGEWNQQEVTVKGRQVKVVLNGKIIIDGDLDDATRNGTLDGQPHPGLSRPRGHLGFLGHGDRVEFRNLKLRELKP